MWYGASTILGRLINYALVPLYTAVLPVEANGVITTLFSYSAFFNVLLAFGMETAYFRFGRGTPEEEAMQASRGQALIACTCAAFLVGIGLAMPWLHDLLPYPNLTEMVWLLAFILITDALLVIPLARLRMQNRPRRYALVRLGYIGLNVGLNVLFLLVLLDTPLGATIGHAIGADAQPVVWVLLAGLLANIPLLALVHIGHFKLSLLHGPEARFMIRYALPIVAMGIPGMANQVLGILQLGQLLPDGYYPALNSTEAVGVYGQCYKLSIFMALVVQAFRLGAEPFFFSMAGKKNKEAGFALVMRWFVLACIGIMVAVSINLGWLAPLVLRRGAYFTALGIVPMLLAANLWLGVYYNLSVWFKLTDRTAWGTWLSMGGMVATVILNLWLIPTYGFEGAAAATLICYFGMAVASYLVGQRFMPVPYAAGRLFIYITLAYLACSMFSGWAEGLRGWQLWAMRGIYGIGYGMLLLWEALPILKARRARVSYPT